MTSCFGTPHMFDTHELQSIHNQTSLLFSYTCNIVPVNFIPVYSKYGSSAHVCCGQTATWIKMPLGREVGLGPGDIVLDGNPAAPPPKGHTPIVGPCLLWRNSCMYQDTTWYRGRPQPRRHCVSCRWGPSYPSPKGAQPPPPIFGQCPLWPVGWMD